MTRVLVYGDVDLNLIDGSAIWLASIAEVLGGFPDVSVTVLQKTRITRDVVIRSAATMPNVSFIDPWTLAAGDPEVSAVLSRNPASRLSPETAASIITLLDRDVPFDLVLVRSLGTSAVLAEGSGLARRLWVYVTDPMRHAAPNERAKLHRIAERCRRIVCQTDEAKSGLIALFESQMDDKIMVLPPMIPTVSRSARPPLDPAAPRLGYSGKFSPPYLILEMLDAFGKIRARIPAAEFHVVGDKFHNAPPVEAYVEMVTRRLSTTPGVVWHGGVSRDEANEILGRVHVSSSWRNPSFDDNVELSTKILEYAALGIPVLMNPSVIQRRVFGVDYPAYVSTEEEFIDRFLALTASPALYERVAGALQATAAEFTFESTRQRLMPLLRNNAPPEELPSAIPRNNSHASKLKATRTRPIRVLFNGHDLKFLRNIIQVFSHNQAYEVRIDEWKGHETSDQNHSEAVLRWADVIFCEWCLGNAKWYSQRKRPEQRLFIRLHHQEMGLPYRYELEWNNVDALIFTNFPHYNRFRREQPEHADKALPIFCDVDCDVLDQDKLPWAEFNLGLVGINPMRKRPDMAFDILKKLRQSDSRYTLFFKTRMPWDYKWLWDRPQEREYFHRFFETIDSGPLRNAVVFDTHGDDMPLWYSKVGFLLSTSDHEGSHQAVAEGMAAGCIPIIRNWDGATPLYPPRFTYSSVDEAVALIHELRRPPVYTAAVAEVKNYARRCFHTVAITKQFDKLFSGGFLSRIPDAELNRC